VPDRPDLKELMESLRAPRTIWAADGTRFTATFIDNQEAQTPEEVSDFGFIRWELRGPDDSNHLWIFSARGDRVPNPADDDVPKWWTILADVAMGSRLRLQNELERLRP
jgi:hypothetical protein